MRRLIIALSLSATLGLATPVFGIGMDAATASGLTEATPGTSAAPSPSPEKSADQSEGKAEEPERLTSSNSAGTDRETFALTAEKPAEVSVDPAEATIVGVSWTGDAAVETRLRTQIKGTWGAWESVDTAGEGPDAGTPDAKNARSATTPVNVTNAEAVQVETTSGQGSPTDLELSVIATPVTAADKTVVDDAAAATSAMAGPSATAVKAPTIVTRKAWGANESLKPCQPSVGTSVRSAAIHHTAGSNSYTKAQSPGIVRGVYSYHTQSQGWCDTGYNFLVDKYGTVYEGRGGSIDKAMIGAHASGFNEGSMGFSVMGTHTTTAVSSATQRSLKRLIAWTADRWGFNPTGKHTATSAGAGSKYKAGTKVTLNNVWGHRDTGSTSCPGGKLYALLGSFRTGAKAIIDDEGGFPVKGAIGSKYRTMASQLGKPVGEERCGLREGGCYQRFQKGQIHWSPDTGAYATKGAILSRWGALGYENGTLGYPVGDEKCGLSGKGCYQSFQNGQVHWSSATGAAATWGAIRSAWRDSGYQDGPLGYPVSASESCGLRAGGCYQTFQKNASIHWSPRFGAQPTRNGFRNAWADAGWENGTWGYPASAEYTLGGATVQDFEFGRATWRNGKATFART